MNIVDFSKAKWIWGADNKTPDQKVVIRKKLEIDEVPEKAVAYIACDTKFWLWINGELAVFEGCVFRESVAGGYAEEFDLAPYLKKGENTLAFLVQFYGNGGRNNTDSGEAGFIFSCDELSLYSDESFLIATHPAYVKTAEPYPAYLFGGYNIGFDAHLDFGDFTDPDFPEIEFEHATVYPNNVWGDCVLSPLPLIKLYDEEKASFEDTDTGVIAHLPYAMCFSAIFEVEAEGGEVIDVRSDRYNVNGGPGDEFHNYNGQRIEFICKEGKNEFWCPMYLYGEKMIVTFPETVKLKKLAYQESGYDTKRIGNFKTDNEIFNALVEKSIRTLYVCMRNNFMDCPDRERGQWIGDVSVQAPQVFFVFDDDAKKLLKKSISDFINLRKGDVLVGNVPGHHFSELPSQSLVAISKFGLLGEYYSYSLDAEMPKMALEPVVNYLKLWNYDDRGLLTPRSGNWRWFDHLWNVDEDVLENCLYVSACKYALEMAEICGNHEFDEFLNERIDTLSANVEKYFWKNDHYASGNFVDDRANAIAMLSGICPEERYPAIRKVLLTVFNSTPYMERFVLKALCDMGYIKDAYNRMMSRYYNLAVNENSTLWEDFFILGTRNHAWTGCPLEIAFKYILGFKTEDGFNSYSIDPVDGIFGEIECSFNIAGENVELHLKDEDGKLTLQ
ncbi:MAG: hypothetical protein IKT46_04410 [Clostridia bacterium]|nr:hypothetical protein [Clostridia bacterium]